MNTGKRFCGNRYMTDQYMEDLAKAKKRNQKRFKKSIEGKRANRKARRRRKDSEGNWVVM